MIHFRKKILLVFCCLIGVYTLFASDKSKWTILVYGNGDNNLSSAMVDCYIQMENVGSSESFKIVCQADFDASRENENIEAGLPKALSKGVSRILFVKSDDKEKMVSKPVQHLPELDMDDPRVLLDFLDWGIRNYPAERYGIVLSDHGAQWQGFGGDTQDGTRDDSEGLTPGVIGKTIAKALHKHRINKVDFVGFDSCLMGGIEVLDSFAEVAQYVVACPEIDFGDGWNYREAFAWLKEHPEATMDEFGKIEVKAWEKVHMTDGNDADLYLAAHAFYDMSNYPAVRTAFQTFAKALVTEYSPNNLMLLRMRRMAAEYGVGSIDASKNASEYIDLGGYAKAFASADDAPPHVRQSAEVLMKAIDKLVAAKSIGEDKLAASGVSIWYPLVSSSNEAQEENDEETEEDGDDDAENDDDAEETEGDESETVQDSEERKKELSGYFNEYKKLDLFKACPWPEFLRKIMLASDRDIGDQMELMLENAPKRLFNSDNFTATAVIKKTPGAFLLHGSLLRHKGKATAKCFVSMGEVFTIKLKGEGKYSVKWEPRLMHLSSNNGKNAVPIAVSPLNSTGEFWTSYAELKRPGMEENQDILLIIRVKQGKPQLMSILVDSEKMSPVPVVLNKGDEIIPVYIEEKRKGKDPDKWKKWSVAARKSVKVIEERGSGLTIDMRPVVPGKYLLDFELENIASDYSYPVSVPIQIRKKQ